MSCFDGAQTRSVAYQGNVAHRKLDVRPTRADARGFFDGVFDLLIRVVVRHTQRSPPGKATAGDEAKKIDEGVLLTRQRHPKDLWMDTGITP